MPKEFKFPKLTKRQLEQRCRRLKKNLPKLQAQLRALEEAKKVSWKTMQIEFNI